MLAAFQRSICQYLLSVSDKFFLSYSKLHSWKIAPTNESAPQKKEITCKQCNEHMDFWIKSISRDALYSDLWATVGHQFLWQMVGFMKIIANWDLTFCPSKCRFHLKLAFDSLEFYLEIPYWKPGASIGPSVDIEPDTSGIRYLFLTKAELAASPFANLTSSP